MLCEISSKTAMTNDLFLCYADTANQVDATVVNEKKIDKENVYFFSNNIDGTSMCNNPNLSINNS